MRFVLRMLVSAGVIFGVAYLSTGNLIAVDSFTAALIAALVLAVVNAIVKPLVSLVALPVTILTLGLFSLVINALMLYIVAWLLPGVSLPGFCQTIVAALVISIATSVFTKLIEPEEDR
jgi:putative membrane protein